MTGRVTYNGHELEEIVPQKTSAYISQNDVHIGVMTVQETLDFSARCQGTGTRHGNYHILYCSYKLIIALVRFGNRLRKTQEF